MYREYALDPAVLSTWEQVRFFLSHVGPWCGRLIAKYPKKWKRMVYDSLRCPDIERSRIEARLAALDERVFTTRSGATYDSERPWLANALDEHRRQPFHAVIAASAGGGVVDASDVSDQHPTWQHDRGRLIPRQPAAYVDALHLLLAHSRQVVLIDPYFRADKPGKRGPFLAFCDRLAPDATIAMHTSTLHIADHHSRDLAERFLPALLPSRLKLTLHIWQQRTGGPRIHNRYLLTEVGGVQFGDGIEAGVTGETDRVSLLEEATRAALWSQYVDPADAFDPVGRAITITGTGAPPRR